MQVKFINKSRNIRLKTLQSIFRKNMSQTQHTQQAGILDDMMQNDIAKWIQKRIHDLPETVRYRAFSAIRALDWSNRIFDIGLDIPASYNALHAVEEAVSAFVCCAKEYEYENSNIDIKNHREKATISFLCTFIVNSLIEYELGIAHMKEKDIIALKIVVNGEKEFSQASLKRFTYGDDHKTPYDDYKDDLIKKFGSIQTIKERIDEYKTARNKIFYATDKGLAPSFKNPKDEIIKLTKTTLGIIWACIDIYDNKDGKIKIVSQTLKTAKLINQNTAPKNQNYKKKPPKK